MQPKSLCNSLLWIILTTICGSSFSADSDKPGSVRISGFRYGLVEFDSSQRPRIYKEGNNFPYKINGTCVAAGKEVSCQWRGFEFSFHSPDEITIFDCVTTSDRPQTYVYPDTVVATNAQTARWRFAVEGRTGHYLRPQYSFDVTGRPLRMTTTCTNKGHEVLRWQVTLTPPPAVEAGQVKP
jgi:hypothetical protein